MSRPERTSQRPTMPPSSNEVADLEHYSREFARDQIGFVAWLMRAEDDSACIARRVIRSEES